MYLLHKPLKLYLHKTLFHVIFVEEVEFDACQKMKIVKEKKKKKKKLGKLLFQVGDSVETRNGCTRLIAYQYGYLEVKFCGHRGRAFQLTSM